MITTILEAPLKTTEDVSWLKPLNNYLLSVYGNTLEFQDDLAKFNKQRQDLSGLSGDERAVKAYFSYYSQLEILDLRIPMTRVNKRKAIVFTWHDAFLPDADHEQYALPFEKASVLFNLGATLMRAASLKYSESRKSDDDSNFKLSLQLMQQAAGVFQFLGENFLHGPSSDLAPCTTRFLVNLCLAQSQEMFNLKVIDGDLEQKKNSLIAKLCSSTAKHYLNCYDVTKHLLTPEGQGAINKTSTFAVRDTFDDDILDSEDEREGVHKEDSDTVQSDVDPSWVHIFEFKSLYYKSMGFYFHGLHMEAAGKYGEAIAYLTKSSDIILEIPSSLLKSISKSRLENVYDLLDNYKFQKDALEIKLRDMTKDNDLIYHDIVPSTVTIAEPKPMDSAKIITMGQNEMFSQINEYHYNNFLKNVVPINIHELLSFYSEEKSQLLRNELDAFDVSNEELTSVMEYLNLPKALVSIKELYKGSDSSRSSGPDIYSDSEMIRKVSEISQASSQVQENLRAIERQRSTIFQNIKSCEHDLSAAPTNASHERFRDDIIKLKQSLFDAAGSDSKLLSLINLDNSGLYNILSKGPNSSEFANLFRVTAPASEPEISLLDIDDFQTQGSVEAKIKLLEDLIYDLNTHKGKKQKLVDKLKSEIHNDDISDIILLNSKVKSTNEIKTVIFPDELKKFDVYLRALDELIEKQKSLVEKVKEAWEKLASDPEVRKIRESSSFKQNLYEEQKSRISNLYEEWKKYSVGLQKGSEFYQRLLTFSCNLQNALKQELQGDLSSSMSALRMDSTGGYSQRGTAQSEYNMAQAQHTGNRNQGFGSAPQLPPKRPSQSSVRNQENQAQSFERREDDLIYNQPSAYQPNIYDMFLKR